MNYYQIILVLHQQARQMRLLQSIQTMIYDCLHLRPLLEGHNYKDFDLNGGKQGENHVPIQIRSGLHQ